MTASFQAFDMLPAQIALLDHHGEIVFTNAAWDGTADGRLEKRSWNYLDECAAAADRGCADGRIMGEAISKVLRREIEEFITTYDCPFDRAHHWFQVSVRQPRATDGDLGAVVMHMNVTSLQYDHLTKLANRALFEAQSNYTLALARGGGAAAGVALIDLDGFKPINDEFGHAAGDGVLVEVARRLSSVSDDDCLVARLGGDEFAIVAGGGITEVSLLRFSRALLRTFEDPFPIRNIHCHLSASIGTALFPEDGDTLTQLMASADSRMYGIKRATKKRHEKWAAHT